MKDEQGKSKKGGAGAVVKRKWAWNKPFFCLDFQHFLRVRDVNDDPKENIESLSEQDSSPMLTIFAMSSCVHTFLNECRVELLKLTLS